MNKLEKIFFNHAGDDFHFGEHIPEKKLRNAHGSMPIKGRVLALLDCTVFGSCKNGVAITTEGIYWSNDWTTDSSLSGLSWSELSKVSTAPSYKMFELNLAPGAKIGVSSCQLGKKKILSLFTDLLAVANEMADDACVSEPQTSEEDASDAVVPVIEQASYDKATAYILALVTVADGVVDEDEIVFAHEFIREEESVKDKESAITSYNESVSLLSDAKSKSFALFKMRANKLFSSIIDIQDDEFFNRISIMLEGMIEAAGGLNNTETVEMVERILKRQSFSAEMPENKSPVQSKSAMVSGESVSVDDKESGIADVALVGEVVEVRAQSKSDGLAKYWPRVERFVIGNMIEIADDKLSKPEELTFYFSRMHDLLPVAVRLVVSQDKFVEMLMSKREFLLERVQFYKLEREGGEA